MNALWGHLGQEAADFFTEKGVRALGDCGRGGHTPFLRCFSTDERVEAAGSNKLCHPGAGRGSFRQSQALTRQAGRRPDSPRENPSVGVSQGRLDPLHLGRYRGRHPVPAPGPYFFPGTLPLRVWETSWEV